MDTRIEKLAKMLTGYSCSLKPGEKVLIEYRGEDAKPLVQQLFGKPIFSAQSLLSYRETIRFCGKFFLGQMKNS